MPLLLLFLLPCTRTAFLIYFLYLLLSVRILFACGILGRTLCDICSSTLYALGCLFLLFSLTRYSSFVLWVLGRQTCSHFTLEVYLFLLIGITFFEPRALPVVFLQAIITKSPETIEISELLVVRPTGFEPTTFRVGAFCRSVNLFHVCVQKVVDYQCFAGLGAPCGSKF